MTAIQCVVGLVIAVVVRRLRATPVRRWVEVTIALAELSLLPPVLTGAELKAVLTLRALHLVAAGVVIPAVTRGLAVQPKW